MATLFKKDAALFVPSGTMANLLAVSCHCPSRGMEVILGNKSHIFMWEQAGISQVSGLQPNAVPNLPDGTFNLDLLDELIRPKDDPHQPFTGLIAVENTHNYCGGKVIPLDFLAKLQSKAQKFEIPVHIDGARILNAAVALDISPDQITQYCDSLCFCFSKGVGAPIGSVVVGSDQLIRRALRMRKVLGGGWRKPGALAAAALVAMEDAMQRLKKDHEHAKYFAHEIKNIRSDLVDVDIEGVHTNIVMVKILKANLTATDLCYRLSQVSLTKLGIVKALEFGPSLVRFAIHSSLNESDISRALTSIHFAIKDL